MKKLFLFLTIVCLCIFVGCKNNEEIPVHEHTYEEEWSYDENYHFHKATCGHDVVNDKTPHAFGEWTIDVSSSIAGSEVATCNICGFKKTRVVTPTLVEFEEEWSYNSQYHFHLAKGDSNITSLKEEHLFSKWHTTVSPTVYSKGLKERHCEICGYTEEELIDELELLQIPMLKKGDTVALMCPASSTSSANVNNAKAKLEEYGFKVRVYDSASRGSSYSVSYLALSDEVRAQELNDAFSDPEIKGIICMRGGYGSSRTLDLLDYEMIRKNPKFLTGYSDITALTNALYYKCGMISYHGFMGMTLTSSSLDQTTKDDINDILFNNQQGKELKYGEYISKSKATVTGTLVGGNLSLISHLLGSEYMPDFDGKVIFIEDTGESEYSLDRLITKLRLFGCFDNAKAIVVGYFTGLSQTQQKALATRLLGDLDIPVLFGFPSGHEYPFINLPIGATVEVSSTGIKIVDEIYK